MKKATTKIAKAKKIAILGFAKEGKSIFKFLKAGKKYKNYKIEIRDQTQGKNYLKNLSSFDIIFRSPGVPYTLPQLYKARCSGIEISSATKLFFENVKKYRRKIIGVTGTKGKSTTVTLIHKILKKSGFKTILAGNVGNPMLNVIRQAPKSDYIILELSSFQLQDLSVSPHIAVVLDVFPDHQNIHKSLREYYGSKTNIGRFQKKSDYIFYFKNNKLSSDLASKSPAKKIGVNVENNIQKNKIMAATVAEKIGCPQKLIRKIVNNFRGLEHRLELTRIMEYSKAKEKTRILFYNDSAATNPEATAMAIRSTKDSIILIAGGKEKKLDYSPLVKEIKKSKKVKVVVLFGENKRKLETKIAKLKPGIKIIICPNLKYAVELAYKNAKFLSGQNYPQISVLFSPASTSFDMFKNYADRGAQFKKEIKKLKQRPLMDQ